MKHTRRIVLSLALVLFATGIADPVLDRVTNSYRSSERIAMAAPAASFPAKVEKTTYKGWNAYRLSNGLVTLYVAPDIGGRAIQMQLGDQDYFYVNRDLEGKVLPAEQNNLQAGWANYGGDKVWPGPEGWANDAEWRSVPDYILDGSK